MSTQFSLMPPRPPGPPQKLTNQQYTYFLLGLPIGFIAVSVALVGLVVVWDHERKLAVSNTDFADLWRRAVQHNPFVQAFMLNFGAIGFGYSIVRLLEHRKALQAEQEQEQRQQQQQRRSDSRKDR